MATPQDQDQLKQGLMDDLASAQQMAKQSSEGRGAPEPSDFAPRSLRIKNKVVAQDHLTKLDATIGDAVKHLVGEANFADEVQSEQYKHQLTQKFNQYKLMMIRQAMRFAGQHHEIK